MQFAKRRHQSFLQGSLILVSATMMVKLIGVFYKIPLASILGGDGMGYFSTAYDLYLPIYSLAMAGLPVAVSRLVAESVASRRFKDTKRLLKIAKKAFTVTGLTAFIIMLVLTYFYLFNQPLRELFNITSDTQSVYAILMISPSILFCCMMAVYRGYYEGLRNMYPTAISQVIEALGKLVIGLGLAYFIKNLCISEFETNGTVFGQIIKSNGSDATLRELAEIVAMPYAAGGAVLGISIGTALGALYMAVRHKACGDKISAEEIELSPEPTSTKKLLKMLITIAIPIVLGSLVTDIASLVDLTTVKGRLSYVMKTNPQVVLDMFGDSITNGLSTSEVPNYLYGCYKGFAYSIYNFVPSITSVMGVSAIPVLCTAWTEKDEKGIRLNIESILRITAMIAIPAGFGITVMSGQILNLLYSTRPGEVAIATPILSILGVTAAFAGLTVPITSMLQAIGKQNVPVKNMAIGVVLKIVVNYILVGIPSINVIGAPVGTAVCYGFIFISNLYCLIKYSKVHPSLRITLVKPFIASFFCAGAAWASYGLIYRVTSMKIATVLAIIIACIVYVISLGLLRAIVKEDIIMLPKGQKIAKVLEKIGWIG